MIHCLPLLPSCLLQVAGSFNKALACNGKPEIYGPIVDMCSKVLYWMQYKEQEAVTVSLLPLL